MLIWPMKRWTDLRRWMMDENRGRQPLPRNILVRLADRQGWRCYYCGGRMIDPMDLPARGAPDELDLARRYGVTPYTSGWQGKARCARATIEHLTPVSRGGTDEMDNLVAACSYCNKRRGDRSLDEFRLEIGQVIAAGRHPVVNGTE